MKIGIVTRHSVPNYGSILQTYASLETMKKLGHEPEVINYIRYEERYNNLAKTLIKGKKWDKNFFTRNIYKVIQTPNYARMYKKFEKYRENFLDETKKEYGSIEELKNDIPKEDVYCSGSDQIWGKIGSTNYDETYFLEFAKGRKCISYASSFGKTALDEQLNQNLDNLLSKYSSILVREKSAKEILVERNLNNVEQVLDPTFLLEKEEWIKLAQKANKEIKGKYILIYQLHDNKEFNQYAKEFAQRKNMKLVRISTSFYHIMRSGKLVYLPTQYEFLSYFQNAQYILTDSFHATVFSIIFNKKFIDVLPLNTTGTRIESVLQLFNMENRILKSYDDFSLIDEPIDYVKVNNKLQKEGKKSLDLLKQAIEN